MKAMKKSTLSFLLVGLAVLAGAAAIAFAQSALPDSAKAKAPAASAASTEASPAASCHMDGSCPDFVDEDGDGVCDLAGDCPKGGDCPGRGNGDCRNGCGGHEGGCPGGRGGGSGHCAHGW